MRWIGLLASLVLLGCATPQGATPKPDVRPVIASHQQAQASIGKTQTYVSKIQDSQAKESESLRRATEALNKYTGTDKVIADAKLALAETTEQLRISKEYAAWADTELANAWKYEQDTGSRITVLSGQIDASHKHEEDLAKYEAYAKPIVDQVNKYWGLGAFIYGFKVLAKHLFILGVVIGVIALALFALSFFFPVIGVALGAVKSVFIRVVNIFRRKPS